MTQDIPNTKPIRLGMVGGGTGAFIGNVHRIAARLDGHFELVAGALASSSDRAQASGRELGLDPARIYNSFAEMAAAEAARADGIEAVSIVTPNHLHYPAAKAFLEHGIHVICDKPLTSTLADAEALQAAAKNSGAVFVLTHNYTGYPLVRTMREMVSRGDLGILRLVQVEYPQDWLTEPLEQSGQKQAGWRTDPSRSGIGGASGDIGTHAFNLVDYVSGLTVDSIAADLDAFVPGRPLDDNGHVLLRFKGVDNHPAAKGMMWFSQVAPGHENGLKIRVYGTKGSVEWVQADPNQMWHAPFGNSRRQITRAGPNTGDAAGRVTRLPGGHPEGFFEAFATIYSEAALAIRAAQSGTLVDQAVSYPTLADGLAGMRFVAACVKSSQANAAWVSL
jgi:predicted dehydrogenase